MCVCVCVRACVCVRVAARALRACLHARLTAAWTAWAVWLPASLVPCTRLRWRAIGGCLHCVWSCPAAFFVACAALVMVWLLADQAVCARRRLAYLPASLRVAVLV